MMLRARRLAAPALRETSRPRTLLRKYSATLPRSQDAAALEADGEDSLRPRVPPPKIDPKVAALRYNLDKAAYKRAVSEVRKRYQREIAEDNRIREEERAKEQAVITRRRLERQRLKNIRSVRNAIRGEERRRRRAIEFQRELDEQQKIRDARKERYRKARELLIAELEEEAPLWLTTPEEVEIALSGADVLQKLWAVPGGLVGAPAPTEDCEYWRYECHTWDMGRTYPTTREVMLEEMEELAYMGANSDPSYWTEERVGEWLARKEKAKLRAMVREEGRRSLLQRQKRMMQENFEEEMERAKRAGDVAVPKAAPAPGLAVLADYKAQEKEGVKILNEDPTRFFRFESDSDDVAADPHEDRPHRDPGEDGHDPDPDSPPRRQLGRPLGLRDPIRDPHGGYPYPQILGREPPPDTRTERERKRQEREEKMREAAEAAARGESDDPAWAAAARDVDEAVGDDLGSDTGALNYEEFITRRDNVDREWERGLDPDDPADARLLSVPRNLRYTKEDLDWMIGKISDRAAKIEELIEVSIKSKREEYLRRGGDSAKLVAGMKRDVSDLIRVVTEAESGGREEGGGGEGEDEEHTIAAELGEGAVRTEGVDEKGAEFVQHDLPHPTLPTRFKPGNLEDRDKHLEEMANLLMGGPEGIAGTLRDVSIVLNMLSPEQREAIEMLGLDEEPSEEMMTREAIEEKLAKIPGLREDQLKALVDLEMKLEADEAVREELLGKKKK